MLPVRPLRLKGKIAGVYVVAVWAADVLQSVCFSFHFFPGSDEVVCVAAATVAHVTGKAAQATDTESAQAVEGNLEVVEDNRVCQAFEDEG